MVAFGELMHLGYKKYKGDIVCFNLDLEMWWQLIFIPKPLYLVFKSERIESWGEFGKQTGKVLVDNCVGVACVLAGFVLGGPIGAVVAGIAASLASYSLKKQQQAKLKFFLLSCVFYKD